MNYDDMLWMDLPETDKSTVGSINKPIDTGLKVLQNITKNKVDESFDIVNGYIVSYSWLDTRDNIMKHDIDLLTKCGWFIDQAYWKHKIGIMND